MRDDSSVDFLQFSFSREQTLAAPKIVKAHRPACQCPRDWIDRYQGRETVPMREKRTDPKLAENNGADHVTGTEAQAASSPGILMVNCPKYSKFNAAVIPATARSSISAGASMRIVQEAAVSSVISVCCRLQRRFRLSCPSSNKSG